MQDRSDEVLIGAREEVVKARTVRRLDGMQHRDADLLRAMPGVPWQPAPGDDKAEIAEVV